MSKIFVVVESCFFKCLPRVPWMSAFRLSFWCTADNAAAPWGWPNPPPVSQPWLIFSSVSQLLPLQQPVGCFSRVAIVISGAVAWPLSVPTVVASALLFHKACRLAWCFTKLQRALWVPVSISSLLPSWSQLFLGGRRTFSLSHHSLAVVWGIRTAFNFLLIRDPYFTHTPPPGALRVSWGRRFIGRNWFNGIFDLMGHNSSQPSLSEPLLVGKDPFTQGHLTGTCSEVYVTAKNAGNQWWDCIHSPKSAYLWLAYLGKWSGKGRKVLMQKEKLGSKR